MQLIYECDACHKFIVIHRGDMSRIPFPKLPNLVLKASEHTCKRK